MQQLLEGNKRLRVEVIYPDSARPKFRRVAALRGYANGWALTDHLDMRPESGGRAPGERRAALRFSVTGTATQAAPEGYQLDDVYVDPRIRN